jgi:hypothetical protein
MKTGTNRIPAITKEIARTVTETVVVSPPTKTLSIELTVEEAGDLLNILGKRSHTLSPRDGNHLDEANLYEAVRRFVADERGDAWRRSLRSHDHESKRYEATIAGGFCR